MKFFITVKCRTTECSDQEVAVPIGSSVAVPVKEAAVELNQAVEVTVNLSEVGVALDAGRIALSIFNAALTVCSDREGEKITNWMFSLFYVTRESNIWPTLELIF